MSHNFLLTGASGYLGGALATQLSSAHLPPHGSLYALVRSDSQARAVAQHGLQPLTFDPFDPLAVEENVVQHNISVVFWLIDALSARGQPHFIRALAKVRRQTGLDVHFLHTSGAKIFSSFSGSPSHRPLLDDEPGLDGLQRALRPSLPLVQTAVDTNKTVIDLAEANGVRSYIFVPCIVYGESAGFGNPISIQTVAIVKAAKGAGRVYRVDNDHPAWPVCHIHDNTALYLRLLHKMLAGDDIPHGKNGHYAAASGRIAWDDLYDAVAKSLAGQGVIEHASVGLADDDALDRMGQALECPKEYVRLQLGGTCTLTARNGASVGWQPEYPPEHILESADDEVKLILKHI